MILGGLLPCAIVAAWLSRGACTKAEAPAPAAVPRTVAQRAVPLPALARAAAVAAAAPEPAPPEALPASLEGTDAGGDVRADATGRLIVDIELRRLFDHFLSASGEEPVATMRARIVAVLRARLPAAAAGEAIAILDRYLAYREAARSLGPADPVAGLDQIHELRVRMFSPAVAQAFFADEEAATHAALARRAVMLDRALSDAERDRRLAEIDARIPIAAREARAAAMAPLNALIQETELRATGASRQQIAAARTTALGAEAAARLAELDRAHAAWDARVTRFRAERAALLDDATLDDAVRQRQIAELLARSFTPPERIRVEALDRLAADRTR